MAGNFDDGHGTDHMATDFQHRGDGLMVVGSSLTAPAMAGWYTPPAPPAILTQGVDPVSLLHALRRRWLLAVSIGLVIGSVLAVLAWFIIPSKASATAYLKVAEHKPYIAFNVDEGGQEANFETYRRTMLGLFKTQPVLDAALRMPGISQLPSIRDESDQLNWLRNGLQISFQNNAELMLIRMEGENAEDLVKLVNASTKAFLEEVVFSDRTARLRIKDTLSRSYQKTLTEIETKSRTYQQLARENYKTESQEANVDRSLAFTELAMLRGERQRIRSDLLAEEIRMTQLRSRQNDPEVTSAKVDLMLQQDPQIMALRQQLNTIELTMVEEQTRSRRPDAPSLARFQERRRSILDRITARQAELRPQATFNVENAPDSESRAAIQSSEIRRSYMNKRLEALTKEYNDYTEEVKRLGERSLELDAMKVELDQLRKVAAALGNKIEAWDIELSSPERVVLVQDAEITPGLNRLQRYLLVGFSGVLGFAISCLSIGFWEFQARRLNGPSQVDEGLGLQVVGELPPLRGQLDESDPRVVMLMEAIDSVRTLLVHAGNSKPSRVVMITSARGREGRTTVSSQLAASLARAGRRTLLVDADLRHPGLHRLFDLPLEDGLCEALRGSIEVTDAIRRTGVDGLWLLTAGACDGASLQALAQDQIQPLIKQMRADYEFIIIDAAPVLNLADSLIIGQHTDGAILSVLRDVSQLSLVYEATERLRNVGIRVIGSVVNGVQHRVHDRASRVLLKPIDAPATASKSEDAPAQV